jgi:hypothetical protein
MDNRGSKSVILFNIAVKEQRVDGSSEKLNSVRCTLVTEKSVFKWNFINSKGKRFTI